MQHSITDGIRERVVWIAKTSTASLTHFASHDTRRLDRHEAGLNRDSPRNTRQIVAVSVSFWDVRSMSVGPYACHSPTVSWDPCAVELCPILDLLAVRKSETLLVVTTTRVPSRKISLGLPHKKSDHTVIDGGCVIQLRSLNYGFVVPSSKFSKAKSWVRFPLRSGLCRWS